MYASRMVEKVIAVGTLLMGVGAVLVGAGAVLGALNLDKIASDGLKGHMSAPDAGNQVGEEAFKALVATQHDHHLHLGNPKRSWVQWFWGP